MQNTSTILMIRPVAFGLNTQTAASNAFQDLETSQLGVQEKALAEFDAFVEILKAKNIDVFVIDNTPEPHTPDSIFPNNWVSFHDDGSVIIYPMLAENRRLEKRTDIIEQLKNKFIINKITDLSFYETQNLFLEGTGSMVLDRENKIAYACISPRTDVKVLENFCEIMSYKAITFYAEDTKGIAIYHTNVMMCVASKFAVVCLDVIKNQQQKQLLFNSLQESGKEIIEITEQQMNHFAGNMLELKNIKKEPFLVMSGQAYHSLNRQQKQSLSAYATLIQAPLNTIEKNGGGSARCMIAEIHLPVK